MFSIFQRIGLYASVAMGCAVSVAGGNSGTLAVSINPSAQPRPSPVWEKKISNGFDPFQVAAFVTPDLLALSEYNGQCVGPDLACGKILLLDVRSGVLKNTLTWSAPLTLSRFDTRPELAPIQNGHFLVKTANEIRLFSSAGQELKKRLLDLKSVKAPYNPELTLWDRWQLAVDPTGQTAMLAAHRLYQDQAEEHWISVDTLEDIAVEKADSKLCCSSLSSDSVVYRSNVPKVPISIRQKGNAARPLCDKCFGADPLFLDDEHILLITRASFTIVSANGKVQYEHGFGGPDDKIQQVSVAPLASRIAFRWNSGHIQKDSGSYHVTVFDLTSRQQVIDVQLSERRLQQGSGFGVVAPVIALSPDGKWIAILYDSLLQLFPVGS